MKRCPFLACTGLMLFPILKCYSHKSITKFEVGDIIGNNTHSIFGSNTYTFIHRSISMVMS